MCLAIPGKVVEIYRENGLKMGIIDFSGTLNRTCLEYVPEISVGEYVIVHAGFAISALDEEEAQNSLQVWEQVARDDH
jgi:hydrogenase expression/formation protein HypC